VPGWGSASGVYPRIALDLSGHCELTNVRRTISRRISFLGLLRIGSVS
jgi:hypothetical protein